MSMSSSATTTLFPGFGLKAWINISEMLGFSLTQPSHAKVSYASHGITKSRRGQVARETTFVEIGPAFFLNRNVKQYFLSFPNVSPMGWGTEILWSHLRTEHALSFGIIDAVRVRHLEKPGVGYSEVDRGNKNAAVDMYLLKFGNNDGMDRNVISVLNQRF